MSDDVSNKLTILEAALLAKKPTVHGQWQGHCAVGLYMGERSFPHLGNTPVRGVFGMIGIEDECHEPVTARCQLILNGKLRPYYWLACNNPNHRRDAGVIEHLDANGNVVRVERFLSTTEVPTPSPASNLLAHAFIEVTAALLLKGVASITNKMAASNNHTFNTKKKRIPRNKKQRINGKKEQIKMEPGHPMDPGDWLHDFRGLTIDEFIEQGNQYIKTLGEHENRQGKRAIDAVLLVITAMFPSHRAKGYTFDISIHGHVNEEGFGDDLGDGIGFSFLRVN